MIAHNFLTSLAIALAFAIPATWIARKAKQQVILGYLAAGFLAGPHLFKALTADADSIGVLSDLGVILLMFSLGLEFSLRRLARIGMTAVLIAVLEVSFTGWLGYSTAKLFGWRPLECILAGAMICISSTVVVAKLLEHAEGSESGRVKDLVFGILIVEDLIAVLLLATLTTISTGKGLPAREIFSTTALLGAFLTLLVGSGYLVIPRLIRSVSHTGSGEALLIAAVGVAFGLAALSRGAGYPTALGAFIAGSLAAESGEASALHRAVRPVRDLFGAMFFISVGMQADPWVLGRHGWEIAALAAVVVGGKLVAVSVASFMSGQPLRTSVQAGLSLGQIGEFGFIMASTLAARGSVGTFLLPVVVGVGILTTILAPLVLKASLPLALWLDSRLPRPVQTYAGFYGTWIQDLKGRAKDDPRWGPLRRLLWVLTLDILFLAGLGVVASLYSAPAGRWLGSFAGLGAGASRTLGVLFFLLLSGPFLAGLVRTARALGSKLAEMVVPPAAPGRADTGEAPRRALRVTFQIGVALLVGIPLLAIVQAFVPVWLGALVLALVAAILGAGFWRSAENLQGHVKAGAEIIAEILARHGPKARQAGLEQLQHQMPGLGELVSVELSAASPVLGKTLAQLNLRGMTGATVLSIRRGDGTISLPAGHETLLAGDVMCLAGTAESVRKAAESL